jgi:CHAD domain-containing protein
MANKKIGQAKTDSSPESFLVQLLASRMIELTQRLDALSKDCSVEPVHQSRVLLRTMRTYLDAFGALQGKSPTLSIGDGMKWLDSLLAPIRNIDVTLEILTHSPNALMAHNDVTADRFKIRLINRLHDQRQVHVMTLHEELQSNRMCELEVELLRLSHDLPVRKSIDLLNELQQLNSAIHCLESSQERLLVLAERASKNPSSNRLHKVRIQAKRVCYPQAVLQRQGLVSENTTVKLATKLHKLLGKHQDIAVCEVWLRKQETDLVNEASIRTQWLGELKQERKTLKSKYLRILNNSHAA